VKYNISLIRTRADYGGNAITERLHYPIIEGETVDELIRRVFADSIQKGHYGDCMEIQVQKGVEKL